MRLAASALARTAARAAAAIGLGAALWLAGTLHSAPAAAQDHSAVYAEAALAADAERLERRARQLYDLLLAEVLTPQEKAGLSSVLLEFPKPYEGDRILEFYTYKDGDRDVISLPIMSLRATEDLTTAVQWLNQQGYSLGTVDLYFAMMRREDPSSLPGGVYPAPLPALGVPADAYKVLNGDDTSMRNDAWAFALLHEMGHILLGHGLYEDQTPEQSRAEEAAADAFALTALFRVAGRPPAGAYFFLQAQSYSLPHPGQFENEAAWRAFLAEKNRHPVTSARMRAIGRAVLGQASTQRGVAQESWRYIGERMVAFADELEDEELQRCIARAALQASAADLTPRREASPEALMRKACL